MLSIFSQFMAHIVSQKNKTMRRDFAVNDFALSNY